MAFVPPSREYRYYDQEMTFYVTFTLRSARVEKWIRLVKEKYLDAAPIKCVGLDCEYTTAKSGSQKDLPPEERQRAAVLQLCVASKVLVFQIVHADAVPEALREFLGDASINFSGTAIHNDVKML